MEKSNILYLIILSAILFTGFTENAVNGAAVADKIRLVKSDIPAGFIYGTVPQYAKKVLKDNPWEMDRNAIRKLADKIYPGGDYSKISGIHVSILAKKNKPYGDDIVCYVIYYRDTLSAKAEIQKIKEFAGYNQDRVIVHSKDNCVIYLHVDDIKDFPLILQIGEKIQARTKSIKLGSNF